MQKNMLVLEIEDAQKLLNYLEQDRSFKEVLELRDIILKAQTASVNFPDEVKDEQGTEVRSEETATGSTDA